jgi:hypothetical protein
LGLIWGAAASILAGPMPLLTIGRYDYMRMQGYDLASFSMMKTCAFRLPLFISAATFFAVSSVIAVAQGAAERLPGTLDAGLVEKFDNWEIRQPAGNKSFFLIGNPEDGSGQLWLQCEHKSFLTVAISMTGKAGRQGSQKSQNVGLQIDDGKTQQFNFIVFESFVALATETPGLSDNRVAAFLDALRDVKNSLVLTYDQTAHQFDVKQLPKARSRFLGLCGRAVAS